MKNKELLSENFSIGFVPLINVRWTAASKSFINNPDSFTITVPYLFIYSFTGIDVHTRSDAKRSANPLRSTFSGSRRRFGRHFSQHRSSNIHQFIPSSCLLLSIPQFHRHPLPSGAAVGSGHKINSTPRRRRAMSPVSEPPKAAP